jgi:hypothetical protein
MKNPLEKKQKPPKFSLPLALITEGLEDEGFGICFLRHLQISDQIYVENVVGNKNLRFAVESSEFKRNVKNVAIVFDGDGQKEKRFEEIKKQINEINARFEDVKLIVSNKLNEINSDLELEGKKAVEIRVFVFLFEKNLEYEFLKTLSAEDQNIVENCVTAFFECAKVKPSDKRIVHAFLSTKETEFGFARDIGIAAGQGVVNFDHNSLGDLKKFLLDFSKL